MRQAIQGTFGKHDEQRDDTYLQSARHWIVTTSRETIVNKQRYRCYWHGDMIESRDQPYLEQDRYSIQGGA